MGLGTRRQRAYSASDFLGIHYCVGERGMDGLMIFRDNKGHKVFEMTPKEAICWAVMSKRMSLTRKNFDGIDLSGLRLFGVRFNGASLKKANLARSEFNLGGFTNANLEGANLRLAVLSFCSLRGANLRGAKLNGASLDGS